MALDPQAPDDRARWNRKWQSHAAGEVPDWLEPFDEVLPHSGRALDVACGAGRGSLLWARRGLEVTGVDVSDVGLQLARGRLAAEGHGLVTERRDLVRDVLPPGPWQAISVLRYRPAAELWRALRAGLAAGGVLVVEVLHVLQLERTERPRRCRLAEPGEVAAGLGDLEVVYLEEGWFDGRALARAIARRPAG